MNIKANATRQRLNRLAWILDNSIPVPGTGGYRVGVDGIIGIIPGIGDAVGAILSAYIIGEAARLGVPKSMMLRMVYNVVIESLVGIVPVVGDIFDFTWKSNQRNVDLLNAYMRNPVETTRSSRLFLFGVLVVLLVLIVSFVALTVKLLSWILGAIT